ncbi:MAG: hypothetical protein IH963_14975 [Chloroflexi bacterium]|nr:hypothetical protein [Chloroflexota bacterium]
MEYGNFDLERILETLTLDGEEPGGGLRLAIEEGGFHALEEFVLARYFMFTQVYFHDVRRAFDLILTDFISELLAESYPDARYPGPDEFDKYLLWDDPYIVAEACKKRDESIRNLAWRIVDRRHPKAVYETNTSPDGGVSRRVLYQLLEAARQEFPKLEFWVDQAVDHPDRFRVDDIMIKYPGNPPAWRSFKTESRALRGLEEVAQVRLYSDVRGDSAIEKEVTDFCRNFMR